MRSHRLPVLPRLSRLLFGFGLGLLLAAAPPALASNHAGNGHFELFAGRYSPDLGTGDEETTYGLRGGYRLNDHFGLEAAVGRIEFSESSLEGNVVLADLSLKYILDPGGRVEWVLFGGPGWAFVDVRLHGLGEGQRDSFTAHAGVALEVNLGDRVYLRPDARWRWFEKGGGGADLELSLALGIRLGRL